MQGKAEHQGNSQGMHLYHWTLQENKQNNSNPTADKHEIGFQANN